MNFLICKLYFIKYLIKSRKEKKYFRYNTQIKGFPAGSVVKNLPADTGEAGDQVRFLGQKSSLEEAMSIHSSILPWEMPWAEEPGGPPSMGSQRVRLD